MSGAAARRLCRLDEIGPSGCREFRLGTGAWPMRGFVIRTDGAVRAYVNRCAHLRYPLNYLEDHFTSYDGRHIECFVHGALFEKDSGLCIAGPCLGQSLASIAVVVEAGEVLLAPELDAEELAARYA
ncbi:MAG TPA: Rieske 2Fe-2S domain-containing protein [Steroidobacteraceae bacterium]|nr:Rieske 2Fe-2S domain-containing protein [Steroidobacteraceae bacterium]